MIVQANQSEKEGQKTIFPTTPNKTIAEFFNIHSEPCSADDICDFLAGW